MRFSDALKTSSRGLRHAKLRSLLTMLGIVIGIASVIILISIGRSAEKLILREIENIGSNLIFIVPGATRGSRFASPPSVQGVIIKTLVRRDLESLRRDPSILRAAPEVRGQARVIFENNDTTITYTGTNADFFSIRNYTLTAGRPFSDSEVASFSRVAVLGPAIAETLFGQRSPVGKTIRLKDTNFQVIGLLDKKGIGPFGIDQDSLILIPINVAQSQLLAINYYNVITVQAHPDYSAEFVSGRIASLLRQNHQIPSPDKDDFTIRTQEDALDLLGNITSVLRLFLTAVASISLVVGGIGIMNIMLVAVVERTREIGLRKAVGATNRDILQQFLLEATMVTLLGGLLGILLGATAVVLLYFALVKFSPVGWVFALPPQAVLLALGVATATGIIFGLYPARQASRKDPIEALRYE